MGAMGDVTPLDGVILGILLLAIVRGLFKGLIGEAFSIASLAAACVAVRFAVGPAGAWLQDVSGGQIGAVAAPWIAGAVIAVAALAAVTLVGRLLKRGASAAGLGWIDRIGGGALGAAEGALVSALLLVTLSWMLGSSHSLLAESRSQAAFERLQQEVAARGGDLPDVASGPTR